MSRLSFIRRLSVGMLDQMVSSGSNFAATLMAARYLDRSDFGAYSVAMVLFIVVLGFNRALCLEALLVRPGDDDEAASVNAENAIAAAMWVGALAGVAFAFATVLLDGDLRRGILVVAALAPLVLVQDALRYVSFSRSLPRHALASDAGWALLMAIGYVVVLASGIESVAAFVGVWMVAGSLAGISHLAIARILPPLRTGVRWVRTHRDLSVPYALNFISGQGAGYLSSLFLAGVAGVQATGALRGALTLFGPANTVAAGAYVVLVPEGRRLIRRSPNVFLKLCIVAGAALGVLVIATTTVLAFLPDDLGRSILGNTWPASQALIPRLGIAAVGTSVLSGALVGLSALEQAGRILRVRLLTLPTTLGLPVLGATLGGADGLATGLIFSVWITVIAYWRVFVSTLRTTGVESD